uniref:Uncharacterized protein n=1 Tax=Corvus moneduloides TaxID=1196302 RepID=A0A8U7NVV7_CORMO
MGHPPGVTRALPLHTGTSQSIPGRAEPNVGIGDPWCAGCDPIGASRCHRDPTDPRGVTGPPCPPAWLVLQVPARALLEGDTVTLRCRGWQDNPVASVSFYREEKQLQPFRNRTELSLSPLQLHHSGRYRCRGWVESSLSRGRKESESAPVTVTVHSEHPTAATLTPRHPHTSAPPQPLHSRLGVTFSPPHLLPSVFPLLVLEGAPEPTEGSPLNLSCLSTPSPLRPRAPLLHLFYRDGRLVGSPQGSPQLLLPAVGVSHSGNYSCQVRSERGPCGRAAPGSASRCAVSAGMGAGSPDSRHGSPSPAWGHPALPDNSRPPFTAICPLIPHCVPSPLPRYTSPSLRSLHGAQVPSMSGSPKPSLWFPPPSPGLPSLNIPGVPQPLPSLPHHLLAPFFLTVLPSSLPDPAPPQVLHCPMVSPSRRCSALGGVRVGAAPRGTGGTGGPPGAELHGGHGDRSPVLLLAPGGLVGTSGHWPPPGAAPRWRQ